MYRGGAGTGDADGGCSPLRFSCPGSLGLRAFEGGSFGRARRGWWGLDRFGGIDPRDCHLVWESQPELSALARRPTAQWGKVTGWRDHLSSWVLVTEGNDGF
jgi:hypothetical protein